MNAKDREYDYLRKEIEICINIIHETEKMLYIAVAAVLAWAVNTSNSLICFISYCVIIPTYFITLHYNITMLRIGAYLFVFYNDYMWEKRLHTINKRNYIKRYEMSYRIPFIFCSIAATALFFMLLKEINTTKILQGVICIVVFIGFTSYVLLKAKNDDIKQIYIDAWNNIQDEEIN